MVRGDADAAVHSAKDLPACLAGGRCRAWCWPPCPSGPMPAGSCWWAVGSAPSPTGATVATGSARRRAQLANLRPDLTFAGLRGNLATRLAAVGTGGMAAVVVAKAAIDRLDWSADRRAWTSRCSSPRSCSPRWDKAHWRSSAGRRRRDHPRAWPPSTTRRRPRWSAPSGPSWPNWAAVACCRSGPTPCGPTGPGAPIRRRGPFRSDRDARLGRRTGGPPARADRGRTRDPSAGRWPGTCSTMPAAVTSASGAAGRRRRWLAAWRHDGSAGRRRTRGPRTAHPCAAPSCWRRPTWSSTTGSSLTSFSTLLRPGASSSTSGKPPGDPTRQAAINAR